MSEHEQVPELNPDGGHSDAELLPGGRPSAGEHDDPSN
jgi:hypothetical protein